MRLAISDLQFSKRAGELLLKLEVGLMVSE